MLKFNGKKIEVKKFPNGESLIDFASYSTMTRQSRHTIELYFENNEDLINLLMVKRYLDENTNIQSVLIIKYMPYSRMDRPINNFVFTLKYICEFINQLNFYKIYIHEPHSYVCVALLKNCEYGLTTVSVTEKAMSMMNFDKNKDFILFPDAGSQKKYSELFLGYKTIVGYKRRNLQTGNIDSFEVICDDNLNKGNVLIVDDLCSKGGTFLATAKTLQNNNVGDIYLAVTHLENNVLKGELPKNNLLKGIFATNSIYTEKIFDKLTILDI